MKRLAPLLPALPPLLVAAFVACSSNTTSLGGDNAEDGGAPKETGANTTQGTMPSGAVDGQAPLIGSACARAPGQPLSSAVCPSGTYCKFDDASCSGSGKCMPLPPPGCTALQCDCDGVIRCPAMNAAPAGSCSLNCGTETCDGVTEYCAHGPPGPMGGDGGEAFMCTKYPTECSANHTCACLTNAGVEEMISCTEKDGMIDANVAFP